MEFRAKLEKFFPKGFHPTHEEIIEDLQHKVLGQTDECIIPHVDVHEQDEPWELAAMINGMWKWKLKEWCFIRTLKGKYKNSKRQSRTTRSGYWKVTGEERKIRNDNNQVIGTKKTLVFYTGHVPKGKRTNWVMHEYHLTQKYLCKHNKQEQMPYIGCHLRRKKDKKGANCSRSESDQADDSTSIFNSSNFTMGSEVAQDDPISTLDSLDNAATDQSSAVVVEDGSYCSNKVVAETEIAEIAGNKDMQIENYPFLGEESIQFDYNYFDCFCPIEFFNDLEMENQGGLIDDDDDDEEWRTFLNWEKLNDLGDEKDKAVLNDLPLP